MEALKIYYCARLETTHFSFSDLTESGLTSMPSGRWKLQFLEMLIESCQFGRLKKGPAVIVFRTPNNNKTGSSQVGAISKAQKYS